MSEARVLIAGIEGGASHSQCALVDAASGEIVATSSGPSTNPWTVGFPEAVDALIAMVNEVKTKAGVPLDTPIRAVGMSLSGGERGSSRETLLAGLTEKAPSLAEHLDICNDCVAPIYTASAKGGVTLIAGTGSNCKLFTSDGRVFGCGGWGHMMGDEASAYFISHRAIKRVFNGLDNLCAPLDGAFDITWTFAALKEYFSVSDIQSMLPHLYSDFSKTFFAGFAVKVAEGALAGDALCLECFREAGDYLALHILALYDNVPAELKASSGGVPVICVGSVFESWSLLQPAFEAKLRATAKVEALTMYKLKDSAAAGGAVWIGNKIGLSIALDTASATSILYTYTA